MHRYTYIYIAFFANIQRKILLKTEDIYVCHRIMVYFFNIPYLHLHSFAQNFEEMAYLNPEDGGSRLF